MIDGQQINSARQRAGLTQQQLAELVGVSLRTVGNWERGATVPRDREHAVRAVLSIDESVADVGLRAASDAELLAEIARRFERGRKTKTGDQRGDTASNTPAGDDPADPTAVLMQSGQPDASLEEDPQQRTDAPRARKARHPH